MVACDGSVSGTAVRAAVKRVPAAASRSMVGATPVPTRSARNVSIVTSRTFRACNVAGGAGWLHANAMANGKWLMAMVDGRAILHEPSAISHEP